MYSKKYIIWLLLFGAISLNAVSAFNSGNSSVDIQELQEKIEGISSLINGLNAKISKLENKIADLEIKVNNTPSSVASSASKQSDIKNNEIATKSSVKSDKNNKQINNDFKSKKKSEIMDEANLMYKDKDFNGAFKRYSFLSSKKYESGKTNYMLGEISYFKKEYANAINYYKKSISFESKAAYTPKLLYHTAISFDKIGDVKSANMFFKVLKEKFPNSKEAKASPNRK